MKKQNLLFVFLIFGWMITPCFSQSITPKIEKLVNEITPLTYSNEYDSAQKLVLEYMEQKNLSAIEIFYGNFLFADILKSSNKTLAAIEKLQDCKKYLKEIPGNKKYESLIYGNIAECNFNLSNYDEAKKNALLSIQFSPDTSLRGFGHAVNYMILGYSDYVSKKYSAALDYYDKAMKIYRIYGASCEVPLCYMKIARVYNSIGNKKLTEENLNKAIAISDSCGIENYKLLSKRIRFDIYKENKNYERALAQLEEINDLVGKLDHKKQAQLINELEVKFETMLLQKENENLKQVNEKNKEVLREEKYKLSIAFISIAVLFALIFLVVWIAKKRNAAEKKLEMLNASLEQKVIYRTRKLKEINEKLLQSELQIRNFAQHLNQVLEDERAHLAREIHDELGQQLTGIKIGLHTLKKIRGKANFIEEKADAMMDEVDGLIQSLRKIATELRPGILDSLGLIPSIDWLINQFEKKTGIKCKFEVNVKKDKFEKNISTCCFRICQEALNNVSKHAGASKVVISAEQNKNELVIKISDNGKGIACDKLANPFSMGLLGMRERANIIGARLNIDGKSSKGTIVQLSVNLNGTKSTIVKIPITNKNEENSYS